MALPVNVCVEAPLEFPVQEITYDGQEILSQPMSMSDNLTKLAHKIDFAKAENEIITEKEVDQSESSNNSDVDGSKNIQPEVDTKDHASTQISQWPWESIRNKLRSALTEICVLGDVLNIVKEKRYMVLDPVSREIQDPKRTTQMMSKKKAMSAAGSVLMSGADRLRSSQTEISRNQSTIDFHMELVQLRRNWHLKKAGSTILGDLSYKTAGSRFWHGGVFEVTKAEDPQENSSSNPGAIQSALKVTIPSVLEGVSYIQVTISQGDEDCLANVRLTDTVTHAFNGKGRAWQDRLESAQNVLFCKELFAQLAREAVQLQSKIPHIVIGNQIKVSLFPGINLCTGLCHILNKDNIPSPCDGIGGTVKRLTAQASLKRTVTGHILDVDEMFEFCETNIKSFNSMLQKTTLNKVRSTFKPRFTTGSEQNSERPDHNHVLEHSLHYLLRELHYNNVHHPMPHPTTATLGVSKRRRLAGPEAYDRYTLLEMTKSETLLEQIVKQAQLDFLRKRTSDVIDTLALEIKDPIIIAHWNCLTSPTKSCVKINIMNHGYETNCRTSLVLHIEPTSIKAICRDGRVLYLSYEPSELKDLILCQIVQHQILSVQSLTKPMNWQILASSNQVGVGHMEPHGNAASCLLSSPSGDRIIAIRYGIDSGIQVSMQSSPRKDFYTNNLVKDIKWQNLGGDFKEIRWEKMEGRNFVHKVELLMASLTTF
ncbi:Mediator of RNA polymerase II transcription subunit 17 [Nymphon striatum]|nr:Mediator of RNA polymerase II transcription subunit 17 [Nymphon striatum]